MNDQPPIDSQKRCTYAAPRTFLTTPQSSTEGSGAVLMSMRDPSGNYLAVIKVVGVGGGGTNAVNRMVDAGLSGVEFIAVNTDAQALMMCDADVKIHIGSTRDAGSRSGRRSGRRPGRRAGEPRRVEGGAEGRRHGLRHRRRGWRHGHRSRADRRRAGPRSSALTVGVVTKPFAFEGRKRSQQADLGIENLRDRVDTLIVIENDRLLQVVEKRTSVTDAFRMADDILRQGVQGITDLITVPGLVNLDFADVRTIMRDAGSALMGIGSASGENRASEAARAAVSSPLLETVDRRRHRHPAQHHGRRRHRPVRGQRGGRGRHERRRRERQRDLRRRDRRRHGRRGARDRDRDRLRRGRRRRRRETREAPPSRSDRRGFEIPDDALDVPSFLRDD